MAAERKPLCVCGGSAVQHTTIDDVDEGCWGTCCVEKAQVDRCHEYRPRATTTTRVRAKPVGTAQGTSLADAIGSLKQGTTRKAVFDIIRNRGEHGATDDEVEAIMGRSHQTVSAARNTLSSDGLILATTKKRNTRYGQPATVWIVARQGA